MKGLRKRVPNKRLDPERIKRTLVLNDPDRERAIRPRGPWLDHQGRYRVSPDAVSGHSNVLDGRHRANLAIGE